MDSVDVANGCHLTVAEGTGQGSPFERYEHGEVTAQPRGEINLYIWRISGGGTSLMLIMKTLKYWA